MFDCEIELVYWIIIFIIIMLLLGGVNLTSAYKVKLYWYMSNVFQRYGESAF